MNQLPISVLFIALAVLIIISAFFSGSETSLMSINRYRLRNLVQKNHKGASRVSALLDKTDKLLSMILLGNNFVNILASAIATVIGLRLYGDNGIAIATGVLTLVILLFAEITPKTLSAIYPEKFAYPASTLLKPLMFILSPFVYVLNLLSKLILRIFGIQIKTKQNIALNKDEIKTVLDDSKNLISSSYHKMLLGILDLDQMTVEDVMVPRNEIYGIDIEDEWEVIVQAIVNSSHTRIPIYRQDIANLIGIVHSKNVIGLLHEPDADKTQFMQKITEPFYIPANTLLNKQLTKFQQQKQRVGMVVNEYGDFQGIVTLEDILEEVIGNFTTDAFVPAEEIHLQTDGSVLVDCTIQVRELNKELGLNLPTDKAKTLNGLLLEALENIPKPGISIKIQDIPIEIISTRNNSINKVRIHT